MRFETIWAEQCKATKRIKRSFGAKSALDYLIGEKLITFADAAEDHAEFAKELPKFLTLPERNSDGSSIFTDVHPSTRQRTAGASRRLVEALHAQHKFSARARSVNQFDGTSALDRFVQIA